MLGYKDDRGYASEASKQRFTEFFKDIKYSKEYRKIGYLYKDVPIYDTYITGSDQMWSPMHPFCIEPYFLTFAPKDKRKISYATSIGVTELTDREKADFKKWLASYDAISVREEQGKQLLESFIKDKNIEVVADHAKALGAQLELTARLLAGNVQHAVPVSERIADLHEQR